MRRLASHDDYAQSHDFFYFRIEVIRRASWHAKMYDKTLLWNTGTYIVRARRFAQPKHGPIRRGTAGRYSINWARACTRISRLSTNENIHMCGMWLWSRSLIQKYIWKSAIGTMIYVYRKELNRFDNRKCQSVPINDIWLHRISWEVSQSHLKCSFFHRFFLSDFGMRPISEAQTNTFFAQHLFIVEHIN